MGCKKKITALLLSAAFFLTASACSSGNTKGENAKAQRESTQFDTYVSNTVVATGNNTVIQNAEHVTYRAWIPVEVAGQFDYCFYFSNTVDSTWDDGRISYAGMSGGSYTIESACVADVDATFDANVEPTQTIPVTFSGETSKEVASGETFWSDPLNIDIFEGHYLLWEWTVSGKNIPAICMSNMTYAYADKGGGKGFTYVNEIPLPQLFGCERKVKKRIVTLGDSITQGCQTSDNAYQFWAAQLLDRLGTENYSLWNLGLGYARASDCAKDGDWLERAIAGADIMTVAFGTNDIISGSYGGENHADAEDIESSIRVITKKSTDAGVQTILWNSPPFDLTKELEEVRVQYNATVENIASDCNAIMFDAAQLLADPADASKTIYGQHPNDEGSTILAVELCDVIRDLGVE